MSAIACLYQREGIVPEADCRAMMDAMRSYHHEYSRIWVEDNLFFGCLMQDFTPESRFEQLPFHDRESGLVITADAVLDNRNELFNRLQVANPNRSQMTDSGLILLAYKKWGERAPEFLIGDFAFVIWDLNKRRLFGARDRMGNRTLYYHGNDERIAFCTTITPLFSLANMDKRPDDQWLAEFMAIPEMVESTDVFSTVYQNIRQLPPAHTFTVTAGKIAFAPYRAWEPISELRLHSNEEYEEAFREVFRQAIDASIRTHRQVGATLSGGLDSGSVASFAAKSLSESEKILRTFSYIPAHDYVDWTPKSRIADERPYIQATVNYIGNISGQYLDFAGKNSYSEMDEWLSILETPYKFFENSFWIKGIYEAAHRENISTLLMGSRGNFSISWGPAVPYYASLLRKWKLFQCYREIRLFGEKSGISRRRLFPLIAKEAYPLLNRRKNAHDANMPSLLINPDFAERKKVFDRLREHRIGLTEPLVRNPAELRRSKLQSLALGNKNGASATKLSLRYGVLERDPTADPRVIQFCLSLPFEQYVQKGMDRALIRRSTSGYLPDPIRLNQRVRGIQAADWVHRMAAAWPAFIHELEEMCKSPVAKEYLNVAHMKSAISVYGAAAKPEYAFLPEVRVLMRALILYRFLKKL